MKTILIYDLNSLPNGVTIEQVKEKLEKDNILIWDSTRSSIPYEPKLIVL